jgi:hypothetical protein
LILTTSMLYPAADAGAQCFQTLALSPGYFEYDYMVRLCVHFADPSLIPQDIICSRPRGDGEDIIQVPIYFYNAHEGIEHLEFAIESNDSILSFSPENCFSIYRASYYCSDPAGFNTLNLKLDACMPLCGPALAGYAYIVPSSGDDVTWINLVENSNTHRMFASDLFGADHYMFSAQYGGFVGESYLYTCQQPMCEEPNMPVTSLVASAGYARSVKLTWTAGDGNVTVIRARTDRYPTGYDDGRLVVEMPSEPGQQLYFFDTNVPDLAVVYYKAWSLTKDGSGNVINTSYVECSAVDTTFVHNEIAAEKTSWGALKKLAD